MLNVSMKAVKYAKAKMTAPARTQGRFEPQALAPDRVLRIKTLASAWYRQKYACVRPYITRGICSHTNDFPACIACTGHTHMHVSYRPTGTLQHRLSEDGAKARATLEVAPVPKA
jgi:hypothetical protein